ncbi:MAG: chromosomal replication initiator protein DnaA [Candidatus Kerfeldbacteria bacterium]|nr:chromosomal replication initiator protein DnaA [Candidatus Kerfeldbacteria bacterium]
MTNEQIWQTVLGELELLISKPNFTTWFKNTFVIAVANDGVVIGVPNAFTQSWLQNKYHGHIIKALEHALSMSPVSVRYEVAAVKHRVAVSVAGAGRLPADLPQSAAPSSPSSNGDFNLNPRYLFDNFVVGKGNALAHASAMAVSEKPGLAYNPLFIYGGAGLGKTHLMQAIGHEVLRLHPKTSVLYVTCERFTNDFIQAVSRGQAESFKNRYRNVDVLLIDDIQFLAGKEGTQEEFFHTFNALHQTNRQIVVTSDRPPKSIPSLEARILSRFEWGMIADIASPDLETRLAILEAKCKEKHLQLSNDILNFLATTIQSNVRELEGALNRIFAYSQLNNTEPSLEATKTLLASVTNRAQKSGLTSKQILNVVASFYDLSTDLLIGGSRKKDLVVPRQITMYLMREELKSSFPNIGQELGGRDHTTAMHAVMKIGNAIEKDEKIRQDITLLRQRLYNL